MKRLKLEKSIFGTNSHWSAGNKIALGVLLVVLMLSCSKNKGPDNPFDDEKNKPPVISDPVDSIGLDNFAGLQRDIFKKTCSNSGCHDGTFEPDFRTLESSYNTLVYQPVIKNNPAVVS